MSRTKPPIDPPGYEEPTTGSNEPDKTDAEHQPEVIPAKSKKGSGAKAVKTLPVEPSEPDTAGEIAMVDRDASQVSTTGAVNLDSPVKLILAKDITDAQYDQIGTQLGVMGSAYKFWLGDLIIAGAKRWNKTIVQVCEYFVARITPQYDVHTLQNIASVMATVTPEVRVEGLSFAHHVVVSQWPATPKERRKMLLKARDEEWSSRVLTQKLNERTTGKPSAGNNVHVDDVDKGGNPVPDTSKIVKSSEPTNTAPPSYGEENQDENPPADGTGPTHPSKVTLSFEASQAATHATEDYNTTHHRNLTVDRFVSNILENLDNLVILSDAGMAALLTLKNASPTGQAMDIGQAASSVFINSVKKRQEAAAKAESPASGPPPVVQPDHEE